MCVHNTIYCTYFHNVIFNGTWILERLILNKEIILDFVLQMHYKRFE